MQFGLNADYYCFIKILPKNPTGKAARSIPNVYHVSDTLVEKFGKHHTAFPLYYNSLTVTEFNLGEERLSRAGWAVEQDVSEHATIALRVGSGECDVTNSLFKRRLNFL